MRQLPSYDQCVISAAVYGCNSAPRTHIPDINVYKNVVVISDIFKTYCSVSVMRLTFYMIKMIVVDSAASRYCHRLVKVYKCLAKIHVDVSKMTAIYPSSSIIY